MSTYPITALLVAVCAATGAIAGTDSREEQAYQQTQAVISHARKPADRVAAELGHKVLAVFQAIENPDEPDVMAAVTALGHDQRYYVMVRGWLSYQLQGDRSIVEASKGNPPAELAKRVRFLEQAIRALDLE